MYEFKINQQVILIKSNGRREIRKVNYADGNSSLVSINTTTGGTYNFLQGSGRSFSNSIESIIPATPELVTEVIAENENTRAKEQAEREAIANDPRTPLISRMCADFEPFHKLTLEQLQTICGWLDSAK